MVTPVKAAPTQADIEADKLLSTQGVIDLLKDTGSNKNKSGTSVSRNLVQLDKVSARRLLQQTDATPFLPSNRPLCRLERSR